MGGLFSKKKNQNQNGFMTKEQILKKYGRLDWTVDEPTNKLKAEAGKRYEGHGVMINLRSSHILTCKVKKVTEEGFLVEEASITGFTNAKPDITDINAPIPFSKFFHVFLNK